MKSIVIALVLTLLILVWASFVYLNFGLTPDPHYGSGFRLQGWDHGLIAGVLIPLLAIIPLVSSFMTRSAIAGVKITILTLIILFSTSGLAYFVYMSQGCPKPYTRKFLENRKEQLANPQKFLADWKERYQKSNPTDTWEPTYELYEKEVSRYEQDFSEFSKGCAGKYPTGLNAETPETYVAFLASLVVDYRIILAASFWLVLFSIPSSLIGAFVGSRFTKRK